MAPRITHLTSTSIVKLRKKLIICLLFILLVTTAEATEYSLKHASSNQPGASVNGENVIYTEYTDMPYWQFLIWLIMTNDFPILLDLKKLFFLIAGFRTVRPKNVLKNPVRSSVYAYIKNRPGAYISEIVEKIGVDRGTVKYHIKTLESQHKIEAYKDGGKKRFFENNFTYNEAEMKVISALQNITSQRIISEIINGKCNTNVDLAHEIGVSRATISWHMRNLKEIDLIIEQKDGRKIVYGINNSYKLLVENFEQGGAGLSQKKVDV